MLLIKGFHVIQVFRFCALKIHVIQVSFLCVENYKRSQPHKMPHKASRTDGQTERRSDGQTDRQTYKLKTISPVRGIIMTVSHRPKGAIYNNMNNLSVSRKTYLVLPQTLLLRLVSKNILRIRYIYFIFEQQPLRGAGNINELLQSSKKNHLHLSEMSYIFLGLY